MSLPHVILPDSGADLVRRELARAFAGLGCAVSRAHPAHLEDADHPDSLARLLAREGPSLLFSVNFQGLARPRPVLEALAKAGGRAAVWCVDNPWNLLAGVRDPAWKGLDIFITDAAFAPALQRHGAAKVHPLPLAGCPDCFAPCPDRDARFAPPGDLAPVVFVGRSAFPDKERFFAGRAVPESVLSQALDGLEEGKRPHVLWWEERLGLANKDFWPGKTHRDASLGAEKTSLAWRALCLRESALAGAALAGGGPGLDVFGDAGWHGLLPPGARLLPPVDYYARLPGIYAKARYTLALTSLQLPSGLNQRHFDVWLAGGFCLTDNTPGLDLFPPELTRPVTFRRARDMEKTIAALESREADRPALQAAWKRHILDRHTYGHRARLVLETMGLI